MVINFRTRGISRGVRKLIWTPMLIKKNILSLDNLRIFLKIKWGKNKQNIVLIFSNNINLG